MGGSPPPAGSKQTSAVGLLVDAPSTVGVPLDVPRQTRAAIRALDPVGGKLIATLPGRSRGRDRLAASRAKRFIDGGAHGYENAPARRKYRTVIGPGEGRRRSIGMPAELHPEPPLRRDDHSHLLGRGHARGQQRDCVVHRRRFAIVSRPAIGKAFQLLRTLKAEDQPPKRQRGPDRTIPHAGTLRLTGRGIRQLARSLSRAGTVKLTIKAQPSIARTLRRTGKATVIVRVTYTPTGGDPNTKSKKLTLRRDRPRARLAIQRIK